MNIAHYLSRKNMGVRGLRWTARAGILALLAMTAWLSQGMCCTGQCAEEAGSEVSACQLRAVGTPQISLGFSPQSGTSGPGSSSSRVFDPQPVPYEAHFYVAAVVESDPESLAVSCEARFYVPGSDPQAAEAVVHPFDAQNKLSLDKAALDGDGDAGGGLRGREVVVACQPVGADEAAGSSVDNSGDNETLDSPVDHDVTEVVSAFYVADDNPHLVQLGSPNLAFLPNEAAACEPESTCSSADPAQCAYAEALAETAEMVSSQWSETFVGPPEMAEAYAAVEPVETQDVAVVESLLEALNLSETDPVVAQILDESGYGETVVALGDSGAVQSLFAPLDPGDLIARKATLAATAAADDANHGVCTDLARNDPFAALDRAEAADYPLFVGSGVVGRIDLGGFAASGSCEGMNKIGTHQAAYFCLTAGDLSAALPVGISGAINLTVARARNDSHLIDNWSGRFDYFTVEFDPAQLLAFVPVPIVQLLSKLGLSVSIGVTFFTTPGDNGEVILPQFAYQQLVGGNFEAIPEGVVWGLTFSLGVGLLKGPFGWPVNATAGTANYVPRDTWTEQWLVNAAPVDPGYQWMRSRLLSVVWPDTGERIFAAAGVDPFRASEQASVQAQFFAPRVDGAESVIGPAKMHKSTFGRMFAPLNALGFGGAALKTTLATLADSAAVRREFGLDCQRELAEGP